jgi:predicted DsbA family dithiol-disulfide isomerase
VTAVRLNNVLPEYHDRVRLRIRSFPLELHGDAAPRDILEQEWWLAAIQEPSAAFGPLPEDWPVTTLPAFDAAWSANQQGEAAGHDYDLRVRRAFFAEQRNIGKPSVLLEIAREAGLDLAAFQRPIDDGSARAAVLAEAQEGRERYRVRGTPTLTTADGNRLRPPMSYPKLEDRKIVGISPLPCFGDGCTDAIRGLFDEVLRRAESS